MNKNLTRDDYIKEYTSNFNNNNHGYYKAMQKYANTMSMCMYNHDSPFTKNAWSQIIDNDALFNKAKVEAGEMFKGDPVLSKRFNRLMDNTRNVAMTVDKGMEGTEGWGGGTAVYASSMGAFAMGATPFIIGGFMVASRSEEIFQPIDNQNNMRLEFEYNIDYLQLGENKYYFPQAYRAGQITGFNKLPKIDWETPNTNNGAFTAPKPWCGQNNIIKLNPIDNAVASSVKGNFVEVCGINKMKTGIEPNCEICGIQYVNKTGDEPTTAIKKVHLKYDIATGNTNERIFKGEITLKNVAGLATDVKVLIIMKINLDTGDFELLTTTNDAATNKYIIGIQFKGKFSNEANEFTDIPTMGTEKTQFVRECEYRNYSKVSLNEYMSDNFRIGTNNNISYAAYASDKMLQATIFNRQLEAEEFPIENVLDDDVDVNDFQLTKKMGGFINNHLEFTISSFAPGLHLQDYKEGLKTYLVDSLSIAETDLNLPASVKRQWIVLGYDPLVSKFPDIKYENAVVDLSDKPEGTQVNENYGYATDTRAAFIDNLGRSVRFLGNVDARWREYGNTMYGYIRSYSMEYPFMVYYPHAIRMFTAIDADMSNRTALYIGGRELRDVFAAGAIQLSLNGVIQDGQIVNTFDAQMKSAKSVYETKTVS